MKYTRYEVFIMEKIHRLVWLIRSRSQLGSFQRCRWTRSSWS